MTCGFGVVVVFVVVFWFFLKVDQLKDDQEVELVFTLKERCILQCCQRRKDMI